MYGSRLVTIAVQMYLIFGCELWPKAPGKFWNWTGKLLEFFSSKSGNPVRETWHIHLLLLHQFNGLFSRITWVSRHQKGKPFWFYWSERWWGGSSISWTICNSKSFVSRSRQITVPVPHHSVFIGRMTFLPPNQQRQSTEGKWYIQVQAKINNITCLNNCNHSFVLIPLYTSTNLFCTKPS